LFGGTGLTSSFPLGTLNDLWEFKPSLNEWAWLGGSKTVVCLAESSGICVSYGQPGTYGTLGTPSAGNVPGARNSATTWTDGNGNLWLFGGFGFDAQGTDGYLNDMWQYNLKGALTSAPPHPSAATPTFTLAAGTYTSSQPLSISDQTPDATIYYTTDGTTPNSSSPLYTGPLTVSSSETVAAIAVASNYSSSPLAFAAYTISGPQAATPSFSVSAGTYTSAPTVTISDATARATIYYTTNGRIPTSTSTVYSGAITVSATETLQAIAVASGYTNSAVASAAYTISPPPAFTLQAFPTSMTVSSGSRGTITLTVTPEYGFNSTVSFACSGLPVGATCSFSPSSIIPSGAEATTALTISTSSQSAAARRPNSRSYLRVMTLALTVFLFGWRDRRLQQRLLLAAAFIGLGLASGCSGGGAGDGNGGGGSTPFTLSVTITATAAAIQQTAQVSLTVE